MDKLNPTSAKTSFRNVGGWVVDVIVGWIVGSIVFGLALGVVVAFFFPGTSDEAASTLTSIAVLAGTVAGIVCMRRLRHQREVRSYQDIQ